MVRRCIAIPADGTKAIVLGTSLWIIRLCGALQVSYPFGKDGYTFCPTDFELVEGLRCELAAETNKHGQGAAKGRYQFQAVNPCRNDHHASLLSGFSGVSDCWLEKHGRAEQKLWLCLSTEAM